MSNLPNNCCSFDTRRLSGLAPGPCRGITAWLWFVAANGQIFGFLFATSSQTSAKRALLQLLVEEELALPENLHKVASLRLNRTIVLVGMMGAGKTSVGKRLAAHLQVPFVDSDHEIETAANMPISEIFARFGEQYFREGEQRVIARLVGGPACVLATGGGAFISAANRAIISAHAVSVWLKADVETLYDRVKNKPGRPLLQGADAKAILEKLLQERASSYAQADVIVESTPGIAQEVMAGRIMAAVGESDVLVDRVPVTLQEAVS